MPDTSNLTIKSDQLTACKTADNPVLSVLAYFDIFQYPLTKKEIQSFSNRPVDDNELDDTLNSLLAEKSVFVCQGYYSMNDNPLLSLRRKEGNLRAEKLIPKAHRIGRFLYKFPFVRAIGVSGSLSKNFADENADIDFFIITKEGRLWIARTIMHLFKKLTFLTGHQHYFCMNYYIDEKQMVIESQNIFTAMETVTLLPVAGAKAMDRFYMDNKWAYQFFPSFGMNRFLRDNFKEKQAWYKQIIEFMFTNRLADRLDNWLFKLTSHRWKQKNNKGLRNKNGHTMQLETGKHYCRSNPGAMQERVLALYGQKLRILGLSH